MGVLKNMIDRGELPAVRVGSRRVRICQSDLDAFLGAGETNPAADVGALREQFRVSLDDARAAVRDDAQLASALRVLADAAGGSRLGSSATRRSGVAATVVRASPTGDLRCRSDSSRTLRVSR